MKSWLSHLLHSPSFFDSGSLFKFVFYFLVVQIFKNTTFNPLKQGVEYFEPRVRGKITLMYFFSNLLIQDLTGGTTEGEFQCNENKHTKSEAQWRSNLIIQNNKEEVIEILQLLQELDGTCHE